MKKVLSLIVIAVMMFSAIPSVQAEEYMNVYALDGRVKVIKTSDFYAWHQVGWYSAPVMYVYAPDGRCEIIVKSDFDAWHKVGWYSAPVMYVYNSAGNKKVVLKSEVAQWKAKGWDYQTGYADNIPWTSDYQYWAVINLNYGPYDSWQQNRYYYINKYFGTMPEYNRTDIKHYSDTNGEQGYKFLVIPRYKTTNTIKSLDVDWNTYQPVETITTGTIYNGVPFTVHYGWPSPEGGPMFRVKTNVRGQRSFSIGENLSDWQWESLDLPWILDLTEWEKNRWFDRNEWNNYWLNYSYEKRDW